MISTHVPCGNTLKFGSIVLHYFIKSSKLVLLNKRLLQFKIVTSMRKPKKSFQSKTVFYQRLYK